MLYYLRRKKICGWYFVNVIWHQGTIGSLAYQQPSSQDVAMPWSSETLIVSVSSVDRSYGMHIIIMLLSLHRGRILIIQEPWDFQQSLFSITSEIAIIWETIYQVLPRLRNDCLKTWWHTGNGLMSNPNTSPTQAGWKLLCPTISTEYVFGTSLFPTYGSA